MNYVTKTMIQALRGMRTTAAHLAEVWQQSPAMAVAWQAALLADGKRKLLSVNQAKLDKAGDEIGMVNVGLTLSPADEAAQFISAIYHACKGSTPACEGACVGNATGQAAISALMEFDGHKLARIARAVLKSVMPEDFRRREALELWAAQRKADRLGYGLAYRPDVASDHQDTAPDGTGERPPCMVYGYTAVSSAMRQRDGVFRAYSRKDTERSDGLARAWVAKGFPVAVVFDVPKGQPLPATWGMAPVIDGDIHDVWPLQDHPTTGAPIKDSFGEHGVVVGLRAKYASRAQREAIVSSGFAVSA